MSRRRPIRRERAEADDSPCPSPSQTAASSGPCRGEGLNRFLLFILLAMIPLRTVAAETRNFELPRWLRLLEAPAGVGPATTFAFFAVILAVFTIVLCRRGRATEGYRWTGMEGGIGLFVLAGAGSTIHAGQKHLALAGSLDLLGLMLYTVALRQLVTRQWQVRLVLTVILATGAVVLTKCAHQRLYELPETIEYYEQHKSEFTRPAADGTDASLRAGAMHDYEQRLKAMSASGYVRHPNVLAGYLILVTMTALAVAAGRIKDRRLPATAIPLLLAAVAIVTFVWAQSKGAAAACLLAGIVWLLGARLVQGYPRVRYTRLVIVFWIAAAVGTGALIGLLRVQPDALGRSMLFRALYWQGAWRMLLDRGPWGVGADNFGRFFPRYKPVECPEDVDDPHSWVVKAVCEHGGIGLAAILSAFVGLSWRLARGGGNSANDTASPDEGVGTAPARLTPPGGSMILWMGGLGGVLLCWWLWLCAGADPNYTVFTLMVVLVPWFVGFLAVAAERASESRFSNDGSPAAAGGICAALIGFLLHAGIDLTLTCPGAGTTFFALIAVAISLREQAGAAERSPGQPQAPARASGSQMSTLAGASGWLGRCCPAGFRAVLVAVGGAGVAAVLFFLAFPAARLSALLEQARREAASSATTKGDSRDALEVYRAAADCYALEATAVGEWIEELSKDLDEPAKADLPLSLAEEYRRRDPFNSAYWNYVAGLHWTKFRLGQDQAEMRKAVEAMREAVAAYPTSPSRRLRLADLLQELAEADGAAETRRAAAAELEAALDLDAKRVYVSKPNRLTEEQRAAIGTRILELRR